MNSIDFNEDFYKKKYLKYKAKYLKLTGGYNCTPPKWKDLPLLNEKFKGDLKITDNDINYNDLAVFYDSLSNIYKVATIEKKYNFLNVFDVKNKPNDNFDIPPENFYHVISHSGRSNIAFISLNKFILTDTKKNQLVVYDTEPNNKSKENKSYGFLPFVTNDKQKSIILVKPRCVAFIGSTLYVIDDGRILLCNLVFNTVSEIPITLLNDKIISTTSVGLAVSDSGKICVSIGKKLFKVEGKSMTEIKIVCKDKSCIGVSRNIAFDGEDTICVADAVNNQVLLINFLNGDVICNYNLQQSSPISIACANSKIFVCLANNNILKICNKPNVGKKDTPTPKPPAESQI